MANTLGKYNPFRYRGYVYDEETGLYYLNSRYYDPELCRFISADSLAVPTISPGSASWDKNLYAYCDNNPVNRKDAGGGCWQAVAIGFGFGIIGQYVSDVIGNIQSGKTGLDILTPSSSGGDYLFAGLGGAVAAISIGSALGTAAFGAFGNLLTEGAQGNIKSHTDLFASCVRGAAYGSIGYLASNVFAFKNVRNIDKMTRSPKKSFLRDIIYKSPQKKVNVNYHVYMEKSVLSKITVIKENVISYKLGIHSTVASTAASVFIRARMTA